MHSDYDCLIIGGGLVGLSLAKAIQDLPLRTAIIEASPLTATTGDTRSIALAFGSQQILASLDIWPLLAANATPIQQIHVSDKGHFGITRLSAATVHAPALGFVVEHASLLDALQQAISSSITVIRPARVNAMQTINDRWCITCETPTGLHDIHARLIIAADGDHSTVRQLQGIATERFDYPHFGLVTTIQLKQSHHNVAYERFTEQGPIALLPLTGHRCGLVWSIPKTDSELYLNMPDREFLLCLQKQFGYRLGRFVAVEKRFCYPLKSQIAKEIVRPGLVLLGNAAHSLHPIAAQGFNLGLRDSAILADILKNAVARQQTLSDFSLLQLYDQNRQRDQKTMRYFTHSLTEWFTSPKKPWVIGRNVGLFTLDLCPLLQLPLLQNAMGLSKQQRFTVC